MPHDPDAKYRCRCCSEIVDHRFFHVEHGRAEYIEEIDMMGFVPSDENNVVCASCAMELYMTLVDYEDEIAEQACNFGVTYEEAEESVWDNMGYGGIYSFPLTWFKMQEPEICCCCKTTLDTKSRMCQISIVERDGRKFTSPIRSGSEERRYTYFCETCVDHTYEHIEEMKAQGMYDDVD